MKWVWEFFVSVCVIWIVLIPATIFLIRGGMDRDIVTGMAFCVALIASTIEYARIELRNHLQALRDTIEARDTGEHYL